MPGSTICYANLRSTHFPLVPVQIHSPRAAFLLLSAMGFGKLATAFADQGLELREYYAAALDSESSRSTFDPRIMAEEALGVTRGVFEAFVKDWGVVSAVDHRFISSDHQEMLRLHLPCFVILEPLSVYEVEVFPWSDPRHSPVEWPSGCAWAFQGALQPPELSEDSPPGRGMGATTGFNMQKEEDTLMAFMSQHGDASVARLAAKEARRQEEERCREEARRLREEQDKGLGPLVV
eukprot:s2149_g8.t1